MDPSDRKGKRIVTDGFDEKLSSFKRQTQSSCPAERLLDGAIRLGRAEEMRRKAAEDSAAAAAEAERIADEADRLEAERVADEGDWREAAERLAGGEAERADSDSESNSGYRDELRPDDPDATSDIDEGDRSNRARLPGILDLIEMPSRTPPSHLTDDGRSWMTVEILRDLRERVQFQEDVEFRLPRMLDRPYTVLEGWMCVYECMFTEFGMNFPLPAMLLRFAAERNVPVSQLTHGVIRHLVFTEALARAPEVAFDRLLFEHVTDLRTGTAEEAGFRRFHTTIRHGIVFGPLTRKKPSTSLRYKFTLLRDLSRKLWPEVVANLDKKKRERKERKEGGSKPACASDALGLKRRAPIAVDDAVITSRPAEKKKRIESPRLRDSSPSVPPQVASVASRTKAASAARRVTRDSSSEAEKTPDPVIELVSSPFADGDGGAPERWEGASSCGKEASRRVDDMRMVPEEGGPSRPPGDGADEEGEPRPVELSGSSADPAPHGGDSPPGPRIDETRQNPHSVAVTWAGPCPLMDDAEASGGYVFASKVHPTWGLMRQGLRYKDDYNEAARDLVRASGKFTALLLKYEQDLGSAEGDAEMARREMERMRESDKMVADMRLEKHALEDKFAMLSDEVTRARDLQDVAKRLRAEVSGLRGEKLVLVGKVDELKGDHAKALHLQEAVEELRAEVGRLEERSRQDAKIAAVEADRLRQSRREWADVAVTQANNAAVDWYTPRLRHLADYVAQREVDEALLNYVRKIRDTDQDFDESIEEIIVGSDDFENAPSLPFAELMLPGSPSRHDAGFSLDPSSAAKTAGPSDAGTKSPEF
ncbi:unnamed protein product [Microthlaspi erraticum]|uniref:Uncharacterized protein n=1 Tax=Microthlaspi erraticum TaxID=1685480 RepID=A0A6D2K0Z2_9BRAS|nr:unnamed protein product [Microthlaspi erraticum]